MTTIKRENSFCEKYSMRSIDFVDSWHNDEFIMTDEDCDLCGFDDELRVSFGCVEIREYPVTVDDQYPAFKDPCPLTLTWNHLSVMKSTVDEFEKRSQKASEQPSSSCNRLTLQERRICVAKTNGITLQDVLELEMEVHMNCSSSSLKKKKKNCRRPCRRKTFET